MPDVIKNSIAVEFRDELLDSTNNKGCITVGRVWQACEELTSTGRAITVAAVGRLTEYRWGAPKTQSIRDQPARLKRLVDLCAAAQSDMPQPNKASGQAGELEVLLEEISNLVTRSTVRAIIHERDGLRRDNRALRGAFQRLSPIGQLTPQQCYNKAEADPNVRSPSVELQSMFTELETTAVRRFLDANFLYDEGLEIDEVQGLTTTSGRIVLPIQFVSALRKISHVG